MTSTPVRSALDVGDVVADVLGDRGQDPVAALEREGVEGHVPGARGARREGDLLRTRAEQLGRGAVEALDRRLVLLVRLVAAHARLELEVSNDSVQHQLRRQRGSGVVEMRHVLAPGRLAAGARDVDHAVGITATPGSSLPSSSSSAAPPPVEAHET